MILLVGVVIGLFAGFLRAWWHKRHYGLPDLKLFWLVPLAFLPQWFAFYFPLTRGVVDKEWAGVALFDSQVLLLLFVWLNRRHIGLWLLGIGLALNLLVIVANGGLMPIAPETVRQLAPPATVEKLRIGARVGHSKDVLLPAERTRLVWLADRFVTPARLPLQSAFSLGDIVIVIGIIWLLWSADSSTARSDAG